jgi:4-amino-4-deoxy-L-arabinose transferase-like glycosyltransferase
MIRKFSGFSQFQVMLGATLALLVWRMMFVAWGSPYGLAPDEAQYWSWLSHNDWSFLTKPPLTTWLMGVGTALLGQTMLGVKLFALLGQAVIAIMGFLIAEKVGGRQAAWWGWALLTVTPLVFAGGLIMSPDAVLLPLWMTALWLVVKAADGSDKRALCWPRWIEIGVLIGLAGLGKYNAAFFFPLLFGWMWFWKRGWLKHPQVWVSGLIALALQAPVIIWNLQHHWVAVAHVMWQTSDEPDENNGIETLEFLGGQAVVIGPIVFGLMLWAWGAMVKKWRNWSASEALLMMMGLPIFMLFVLMTFHNKVQANWAVLGVVGGLLVLAVWLARQQKVWVTRVAWGGVALSLLLGVMLLDTFTFRNIGMFPIKPKNDPTKDLRGWPEMGQLLGLMLYKLDRPVLMSDRYQTLAPMMFHTLGHPEAVYMNSGGRRLNEYDLWPVDVKDRLVVYVNENNNLPAPVAARFKQCTPWHNMAVEDRGVQTRRLYTWLCFGAEK